MPRGQSAKFAVGQHPGQTQFREYHLGIPTCEQAIENDLLEVVGREGIEGEGFLVFRGLLLFAQAQAQSFAEEISGGIL